MKKLSIRVEDATWDWIRAGAKERKIGEGEFLDHVAARGLRLPEESPEKTVKLAEEIELPNGLLKITRDEEGLPIGFVRAKAGDAWKPIDWRKLELLNVEVQGLKRDKLAEEVKTLKTKRTILVHRMPAGARHELAMEDDTAQPTKYWCKKDRVTAETPDEIEAHRKLCGEQYLEPYFG